MMIDPIPVQKFMQRVAKMAQMNQSDLRLTMPEALELSAALSAILVDMAANRPVIESVPVQSIEPLKFDISGGSFT